MIVEIIDITVEVIRINFFSLKIQKYRDVKIEI